MVNSTPLYASFDHPDEPLPVSPSNLLTLKTDSAYPIEMTDYCERDLMRYGMNRWKRVQVLADAFRKKWGANYLQELTALKRWTQPRTNLSEGDVVLLREKNVPRGDWRIARVSRPIPSRDGLVRKVMLRFLDGRGKARESERAVTDLVLLVSPTQAGSVTADPLDDPSKE